MVTSEKYCNIKGQRCSHLATVLFKFNNLKSILPGGSKVQRSHQKISGQLCNYAQVTF